MRRFAGLLTLVLFSCLAASVRAEPVTAPIKLFNGRDLTNFYTYLVKYGKNNDPEKVFTVEQETVLVPAGRRLLRGRPRYQAVTQGMIRVSGKVFGCFTTEKEYENYHLVVEFKWGDETWAPREKATMDSGILLHCVGADGAAGPWMESIECQMIEGGTGDFILVRGKGQPKLTVTAEQRAGQWYYKPGAPAKEFSGGRINWSARDPDWKDIKGFRGKHDLENPIGQWNTLECICDSGKITNILNGRVVNAGTNASHTKGKILFQSEGAEVFFRRIDLLPLSRSRLSTQRLSEKGTGPLDSRRKSLFHGANPRVLSPFRTASQ